MSDTRTDAEKLEQLRDILRPIIDWTNRVLEEGEPDDSYLYDMTWDKFQEQLFGGQYAQIIEILR